MEPHLGSKVEDVQHTVNRVALFGHEGGGSHCVPFHGYMFILW